MKIVVKAKIAYYFSVIIIIIIIIISSSTIIGIKRVDCNPRISIVSKTNKVPHSLAADVTCKINLQGRKLF